MSCGQLGCSEPVLVMFCLIIKIFHSTRDESENKHEKITGNKHENQGKHNRNTADEHDKRSRGVLEAKRSIIGTNTGDEHKKRSIPGTWEMSVRSGAYTLLFRYIKLLHSK